MDSVQCFPSLDPSQGLTANPDISGIGVRTAVYTQAVLSLVHPLVVGYDGEIEDYEIRSLVTVYLGILLPGYALLLSTIIQAKTYGLSVYHGTIVLYLSWINNTSALTFFMLVLGDQVIEESGWWEEMGPEPVQMKLDSLDWEWDFAKGDIFKQLNVLKKVEEIMEETRREANSARSGYSKQQLKREAMEATRWRIEKEIEMVTEASPRPLERERASLLENLEKQKKRLVGLLANSDAAQFFHRTRALANDIEEMEGLSGRVAGRVGIVSVRISKFRAIPHRVWGMAILASAHLILVSGFGLWVWVNIQDFGIDQGCIPRTHLVLFAKAIPITSPVLRSRSIGVYIISSLPVVNILIWIFLLVIIPSLFASFWSCIRTTPNGTLRRIFFASAVFTILVVQILLILFTEQTITNNGHLLKTGPQDAREGDWTFGQTLAITLTVIPSIEVIKFVRLKLLKSNWWKGWMKEARSRCKNRWLSTS